MAPREAGAAGRATGAAPRSSEVELPAGRDADAGGASGVAPRSSDVDDPDDGAVGRVDAGTGPDKSSEVLGEDGGPAGRGADAAGGADRSSRLSEAEVARPGGDADGSDRSSELPADRVEADRGPGLDACWGRACCGRNLLRRKQIQARRRSRRRHRRTIRHRRAPGRRVRCSRHLYRRRWRRPGVWLSWAWCSRARWPGRRRTPRSANSLTGPAEPDGEGTSGPVASPHGRAPTRPASLPGLPRRPARDHSGTP